MGGDAVWHFFGIFLNFVAGSSCGLAILPSSFGAMKIRDVFWTRDSGFKVLGLDPLQYLTNANNGSKKLKRF